MGGTHLTGSALDSGWSAQKRGRITRILHEKAESGGYTRWSAGTGAFLLWGRAEVEKRGEVASLAAFNRFSPLPECFELERRNRIPSVPWLGARLQEEDLDGLDQTHQKLKEDFSDDDGCVPAEHIPRLITWRDGLEKQLRRVHERLLEPLEMLRDVLKVWYMEALKPIIIPHEEYEAMSDKESQEYLHQRDELLNDALHLWRTASAGTASSVMEGWLPGMLPREGAPEELVEAQRYGFRYFLYQRDKLLEEALSLHCQWWALEALLQRALIGEPVMNEDEIRELARERFRAAHDHTMSMGQKVHEYRKKHGHDYGMTSSGKETPVFTANGIKDWLREDMINPDRGKPYSRATVLSAAQATDCWVNTKQGSTAGLKETLDNLENYYLKYRQKSGN